jgi:hypothetical protein
VAQSELCYSIDILLLNRHNTAPRRVSPGSTQPHQIGTHAIHTRSKTALCDDA